ncbi:uncharacterized protein LOC110464140 [Mizuhopecten yessoensis]|uniref:uncharacterized protein LOC110464140 n=1 Tax=Mizuhopecten yessoensis TaxID=6573 RepID=UPI000B457DDC|nr:uncharacterized protein LOC110464140 [Mizuhopecten yessoensis]
MAAVSVYQYSKDFRVTDQVRQEFDQHGYIVLKGVLDKEEVSLVEKTIGGSDAITKHKFGDFVDGGRKTDTVLWKHPGNDVTGMVSRSEKVAGIAEQLLGGEVYHYHTKLMLKEGGRGAKHAWHQDYSYWYWNGCLFPDMLTVFIPLDDCRKENSCLQILRGSHKCGRIHHKTVGEQNGCDVERIEELKAVCPHVFMEIDAGDAVFFHCNIIHSSSQNDSHKRRWAFLTAYNRATNNPTKVHHHPQYTPLEKVPNTAIKECKNLTDMTGKEFVDPVIETTYKSLFKDGNSTR